MGRRSDNSHAVIGVLAILFIGFMLVASYKIATHIEETTITVVSKERLMEIGTDSEGRSHTTYKNFVYSDDEAYVVADSMWNGHFRARSVYAQVHEGATCRVTLSGYRFGFLSMHQNIIAAECSK